MPAKGKGRGAKKTQENVVDSTTNQKSEEKIEDATTTAQNNADKKSIAAKRKQTKNGDAEIPSVPEKRGRGRPAAATRTTEQSATASSAKKQEERESLPEKQRTKGKKGGKKGAPSVAIKSVVIENETREKDEPKDEESEPETKAVDGTTSAAAADDDDDEDDKPIQARRGRNKILVTTETENGESQKDVKGGKRGAVGIAKKEKQVTNGDAEPVKKGRNPVKSVGKKTAIGGGRRRKRAAVADAQEEIDEQNGSD